MFHCAELENSDIREAWQWLLDGQAIATLYVYNLFPKLEAAIPYT